MQKDYNRGILARTASPPSKSYSSASYISGRTQHTRTSRAVNSGVRRSRNTCQPTGGGSISFATYTGWRSYLDGLDNTARVKNAGTINGVQVRNCSSAREPRLRGTNNRKSIFSALGDKLNRSNVAGATCSVSNSSVENTDSCISISSQGSYVDRRRVGLVPAIFPNASISNFGLLRSSADNADCGCVDATIKPYLDDRQKIPIVPNFSQSINSFTKGLSSTGGNNYTKYISLASHNNGEVLKSDANQNNNNLMVGDTHINADENNINRKSNIGKEINDTLNTVTTFSSRSRISSKCCDYLHLSEKSFFCEQYHDVLDLNLISGEKSNTICATVHLNTNNNSTRSRSDCCSETSNSAALSSPHTNTPTMKHKQKSVYSTETHDVTASVTYSESESATNSSTYLTSPSSGSSSSASSSGTAYSLSSPSSSCSSYTDSRASISEYGSTEEQQDLIKSNKRPNGKQKTITTNNDQSLAAKNVTANDKVLSREIRPKKPPLVVSRLSPARRPISVKQNPQSRAPDTQQCSGDGRLKQDGVDSTVSKRTSKSSSVNSTRKQSPSPERQTKAAATTKKVLAKTESAPQPQSQSRVKSGTKCPTEISNITTPIYEISKKFQQRLKQPISQQRMGVAKSTATFGKSNQPNRVDQSHQKGRVKNAKTPSPGNSTYLKAHMNGVKGVSTTTLAVAARIETLGRSSTETSPVVKGEHGASKTMTIVESMGGKNEKHTSNLSKKASPFKNRFWCTPQNKVLTSPPYTGRVNKVNNASLKVKSNAPPKKASPKSPREKNRCPTETSSKGTGSKQQCVQAKKRFTTSPVKKVNNAQQQKQIVVDAAKTNAKELIANDESDTKNTTNPQTQADFKKEKLKTTSQNVASSLRPKLQSRLKPSLEKTSAVHRPTSSQKHPLKQCKTTTATEAAKDVCAITTPDQPKEPEGIAGQGIQCSRSEASLPGSNTKLKDNTERWVLNHTTIVESRTGHKVERKRRPSYARPIYSGLPGRSRSAVRRSASVSGRSGHSWTQLSALSDLSSEGQRDPPATKNLHKRRGRSQGNPVLQQSNASLTRDAEGRNIQEPTVEVVYNAPKKTNLALSTPTQATLVKKATLSCLHSSTIQALSKKPPVARLRNVSCSPKPHKERDGNLFQDTDSKEHSNESIARQNLRASVKEHVEETPIVPTTRGRAHSPVVRSLSQVALITKANANESAEFKYSNLAQKLATNKQTMGKDVRAVKKPVQYFSRQPRMLPLPRARSLSRKRTATNEKMDDKKTHGLKSNIKQDNKENGKKEQPKEGIKQLKENKENFKQQVKPSSQENKSVVPNPAHTSTNNINTARVTAKNKRHGFSAPLYAEAVLDSSWPPSRFMLKNSDDDDSLIGLLENEYNVSPKSKNINRKHDFLSKRSKEKLTESASMIDSSPRSQSKPCAMDDCHMESTRNRCRIIRQYIQDKYACFRHTTLDSPQLSPTIDYKQKLRDLLSNYYHVEISDSMIERVRKGGQIDATKKPDPKNSADTTVITNEEKQSSSSPALNLANDVKPAAVETNTEVKVRVSSPTKRPQKGAYGQCKYARTGSKTQSATNRSDILLARPVSAPSRALPGMSMSVYDSLIEELKSHYLLQRLEDRRRTDETFTIPNDTIEIVWDNEFDDTHCGFTTPSNTDNRKPCSIDKTSVSGEEKEGLDKTSVLKDCTNTQSTGKLDKCESLRSETEVTKCEIEVSAVGSSQFTDKIGPAVFKQKVEDVYLSKANGHSSEDAPSLIKDSYQQKELSSECRSTGSIASEFSSSKDKAQEKLLTNHLPTYPIVNPPLNEAAPERISSDIHSLKLTPLVSSLENKTKEPETSVEHSSEVTAVSETREHKGTIDSTLQTEHPDITPTDNATTPQEGETNKTPSFQKYHETLDTPNIMSKMDSAYRDSLLDCEKTPVLLTEPLEESKETMFSTKLPCDLTKGDKTSASLQKDASTNDNTNDIQTSKTCEQYQIVNTNDEAKIEKPKKEGKDCTLINKQIDECIDKVKQEPQHPPNETETVNTSDHEPTAKTSSDDLKYNACKMSHNTSLIDESGKECKTETEPVAKPIAEEMITDKVIGTDNVGNESLKENDGKLSPTSSNTSKIDEQFSKDFVLEASEREVTADGSNVSETRVDKEASNCVDICGPSSTETKDLQSKEIVEQTVGKESTETSIMDSKEEKANERPAFNDKEAVDEISNALKNMRVTSPPLNQTNDNHKTSSTTVSTTNQPHLNNTTPSISHAKSLDNQVNDKISDAPKTTKVSNVPPVSEVAEKEISCLSFTSKNYGGEISLQISPDRFICHKHSSPTVSIDLCLKPGDVDTQKVNVRMGEFCSRIDYGTCANKKSNHDPQVPFPISTDISFDATFTGDYKNTTPSYSVTYGGKPNVAGAPNRITNQPQETQTDLNILPDAKSTPKNKTVKEENTFNPKFMGCRQQTEPLDLSTKYSLYKETALITSYDSMNASQDSKNLSRANTTHFALAPPYTEHRFQSPSAHHTTSSLEDCPCKKMCQDLEERYHVVDTIACDDSITLDLPIPVSKVDHASPRHCNRGVKQLAWDENGWETQRLDPECCHCCDNNKECGSQKERLSSQCWSGENIEHDVPVSLNSLNKPRERTDYYRNGNTFEEPRSEVNASEGGLFTLLSREWNTALDEWTRSHELRDLLETGDEDKLKESGRAGSDSYGEFNERIGERMESRQGCSNSSDKLDCLYGALLQATDRATRQFKSRGNNSTDCRSALPNSTFSQSMMGDKTSHEIESVNEQNYVAYYKFQMQTDPDLTPQNMLSHNDKKTQMRLNDQLRCLRDENDSNKLLTTSSSLEDWPCRRQELSYKPVTDVSTCESSSSVESESFHSCSSAPSSRRNR